MSIVKALTNNRSLALLAKSVTLIIQLSCSHSESPLNGMVLSPVIAPVVLLEQSHEYVMVHCLVVLKV